MFEYWQDAGARASSKSKTAKRKSPARRSSKRVGRTVTFKNGVKAQWKKEGGKTVLRITKGLSPTKFKKTVASKRGKRTRMTQAQARRSMQRYYRNRHSDPRARAIAIGRDMCGSNKPVVRSSKYKRSPLRYDFKGVDDGSKCPAGSPTKRRRMSAKAKKELVARLQKGKARAARRSANKASRTKAARRSKRASGRK